MFKNNYLQLYKSSSSQHINPNILITHFHHIYSTLGCVLQDLQYQIGRLVLQNTQFSQILQKDQKYRHIEINRNERTSKGRQSKQIKEVDRRSGRSQERQQFSRRSTKGGYQKQIKNKYIPQAQKPKLDQYISNKTPQGSDFLNFILKQDKIKQKSTSYYPQQKAKNYLNKHTQLQYEDLFKYDKHQKKEIKYQQLESQMKKQQSGGKKIEAEASYDDFMDKIFKDAQNKKNK